MYSLNAERKIASDCFCSLCLGFLSSAPFLNMSCIAHFNKSVETSRLFGKAGEFTVSAKDAMGRIISWGRLSHNALLQAQCKKERNAELT